MRKAYLASGEGTIVDALCADGFFPELVVTDRKCAALSKAAERGIAAVHRPRRGKWVDGVCDPARVEYTQSIGQLLREFEIELVVMAGWMPVFSRELFEMFPARVLNIHPSWFKDGRAVFPGKYDVAVQAALDANAAGKILVTGSTVHIATGEVDEGPALSRFSVPILPDDDVHTLHGRMKTQEQKLYPFVLGRIETGKINLDKEMENWLKTQG